MNERIPEQRGNVMVIAMLLIMVMMMIGLATIAISDTQTGQSRKERERESTFNLSESVLTSQAFVLGRNGAGSTAAPFPNKCTPATSTQALCPHPDEITRSFDGATQKDFAAGSTWETTVRDNQEPSNSVSTYYSPSLTNSDCGASATDHIYCYDNNGDNKLWVRASSTVRAKTRTIVALVEVELRPVTLPQFAVLAGSFMTTNVGNKVIVDSAPLTTGIAVRCTTTGPSAGDPCLGFNESKGQLAPGGAWETGYPAQPAVAAEDLLAFEDAAKGAGTWYATCPANPNGKIVYVKSGDCSYGTSAPAAAGQSKCCNSPAPSSPGPGLFIIENGTLAIGGSIAWNGVIYAVNKQNTSGTVVSTSGTSVIFGGVIVDGNGGVAAGASGLNIDFEPNAFTGITQPGTAGVVQNTWRELPPD
jgi:Tfp pilus assembly protein PilX